METDRSHVPPGYRCDKPVRQLRLDGAPDRPGRPVVRFVAATGVGAIRTQKTAPAGGLDRVQQNVQQLAAPKHEPLNLLGDFAENIEMAPRAGFEPATIRLTVECSTTELPGNSEASLARRSV